MIQPMLAVPMSKANITSWADWAIEEKYDGHRLIVQVQRAAPYVTAWTRPRKHAGDLSGKSMATKPLPAHLVSDLVRSLPSGVYDGELLGGETSTDVTRLDLADTLRFVVFDVLRFGGSDVMHCTWDERHLILHRIFAANLGKTGSVSLATPMHLTCEADAQKFITRIWERGGEGAILKRRGARYQAGKRSPDFVKIKKLFTTVCTIIGFEPTRGKVLKRGLFATVMLRDINGNETSVKTKDDAELESFQRAWEATGIPAQSLTDREELRLANIHHPALGTKLRIEYQDWTPRGGYRHPRWDRWENE